MHIVYDIRVNIYNKFEKVMLKQQILLCLYSIHSITQVHMISGLTEAMLIKFLMVKFTI